MSLSSFILSKTVGIALPKYRTLGQWADVYCEIVDGLPVTDKTKANRKCALAHVIGGLGAYRTISAIRPHDVSSFVMRVHKSHPPLAKRVLIEAKAVFNEAMNYAWIDRNPATQVKAPQVSVTRNRLTLDQWRLIHAHAAKHMPPWVPRMMTLALVSGQRRSDIGKMRFADVWDGHLHVEQAKTGARLALPLSLRLDSIGVSSGEAVEDCRGYVPGDDYLIRKSTGKPPCLPSLSARFEEARDEAIPACLSGSPTSLHECRSLSERLYREQGVNTMVLLGHTTQQMTDMYNDDRGLSSGKWKTLSLS